MREMSYFLIFFIVIAVFKIEPNRNTVVSFTRTPASTHSDCHNTLINFLMNTREQRPLAMWRRLIGMQTQDFAYDYHRELESQIFIALSKGEQVNIPSNVEGILAYIKALSRVYTPEDQLAVTKMTSFRHGKLQKIVGKMKNKKKLGVTDFDELVEDLFMNAFGPKNGLRDNLSMDTLTKKHIARIVQEDLVTRGLLGVFHSYRMSMKSPNFVSRFRKSRLGRMAMTGIFNIPVVFGVPPIYLPKTRPVQLSDSLAGELLENGLNDDVYRRVEMELSSSIAIKARYETIRSYYIAGAITYVTLAALYDSYQMNKDLIEQEQIIEQAAEEASETIDDMTKLEEGGIDLFSENSVESGHVYCRSLEDCFNEFGLDITNLDLQSAEYLTCQNVIDPQGKCQAY